MLFDKPKAEPQVDRRGIFRGDVDIAIRNALSSYTTKDLALCHDIANDLEQFAIQVRAYMAMHRPVA
jgi:hypothetical protein